MENFSKRRSAEHRKNAKRSFPTRSTALTLLLLLLFWLSLLNCWLLSIRGFQDIQIAAVHANVATYLRECITARFRQTRHEIVTYIVLASNQYNASSQRRPLQSTRRIRTSHLKHLAQCPPAYPYIQTRLWDIRFRPARLYPSLLSERC